MSRTLKIGLAIIVIGGAAIFADARFGTFNGAAAGVFGGKILGFNIGMPPDKGVSTTAGGTPEG